MKNLKLHKPAITISQQIENLISIGVIINNKEYAKNILSRISYYRLIKAYSTTLKEKGIYKKSTCFENIVNLYDFNGELRRLIFVLIEDIEISLRAIISNHFSLKYGNFGHLDINNFDKKEAQKRVKKEIEREISRNNRSPIIRNFTNNYIDGKVPLYASLEVASFGTLSKLYKNMKNEDKNEIAKFYGMEYFYFESFIENFAYIRNICAHYGRLYDIKITKSPKVYKHYRKYNISNNTLFASILSLRLVANEKVFNDFYIDLISLIEKYKIVDVKYMGFPKNWKELLKP